MSRIQRTHTKGLWARWVPDPGQSLGATQRPAPRSVGGAWGWRGSFRRVPQPSAPTTPQGQPHTPCQRAAFPPQARVWVREAVLSRGRRQPPKSSVPTTLWQQSQLGSQAPPPQSGVGGLGTSQVPSPARRGLPVWLPKNYAAWARPQSLDWEQPVRPGPGGRGPCVTSTCHLAS